MYGRSTVAVSVETLQIPFMLSESLRSPCEVPASSLAGLVKAADNLGELAEHGCINWGESELGSKTLCYGQVIA